MLLAPEPLTSEHRLHGFDSGVASIDEWLLRRALQNQASGAARTFVVCEVHGSSLTTLWPPAR